MLIGAKAGRAPEKLAQNKSPPESFGLISFSNWKFESK